MSQREANIDELVRIIERAIAEIRMRWYSYVKHKKPGPDGRLETYTSADVEVQEVIVTLLRSRFPGYGIIAEEEDLRIACELPGVNAYFTVDSIDGTVAFQRNQAFGVGTQLALVIDGDVAAAVIGDANSGDIYSYSRKTPGVFRRGHGRIVNLLTAKDVQQRRAKPLSEQVLQLWKSPEHIESPFWRQLIKPHKFGGPFLDYHIIPGSIALRVMRVLTREIGATLLYLRTNTPWDSAPIIGMTQQLDIAWLRLTAAGDGLERYEPSPSTEITTADKTVLLIPKEKLPELLAAM